ncbi:MAG: beta-propeller domain-containing protein [Candidatus Gracilibacteria bacterium]
MVINKNSIKDKKIIFGIIGAIFLFIYYVFFAHGKIDLSFSAKDLEIKTIDNKDDFEDIIVKNTYDKIVESCDNNNERNRQYYEGEQFNEPMFSNSNSRISFDGNIGSSLKGSADMGVKGSVSDGFDVPSIGFDGQKSEPVVTQDVSFSQTNIQKQEVDEGDILKQTKDYIFYFSKIRSKIFIIKSPLDGEQINLDFVNTVFTIDIPNNLTIKPELFVNDTRLVYLASKKSYDNNNTIVGIYDISNLANKDVKLTKIFETKGDYFKSRLVNNNLYLISDYSMESFKTKYCNIINNEKKSNFVDFVSFFTGINLKGFGLNKELYEELKTELESYSYKFNDNNLLGKGDIENLEKFKLFYSEKDLKEPIENLNFNIVSVVDIDNKELKASQTLLFGNLKNGEIHMTLDNLYLVNSYYQKEQWKCDYIDICYKEFSSNNFTSISKISYSGNNLQYLKSAVIPGKPINQYAMDEDEGYFRIFTTNGNMNRDSSLYVFEKNLKLIGSLENIKPGEEFKSARFIGDKAFLVTFRQTDPLFVIDLHIPSNPKIIGELQIPGYSTYLHPYGKVGNKDYLIGIGRENSSVKVDLYEIDYEKQSLGNQIDVKQKYSYKFEGDSTETPVLDNPRAFVWDDVDKILYLPIKNWPKHLQVDCDSQKQPEKLCFRTYDSNENINKYRKWITTVDSFLGLKALSIKVDDSIKEIESKQVPDRYFNSPDITNLRVGYYKNGINKSLFFIDGGFISFFNKNNEEKTIDF